MKRLLIVLALFVVAIGVVYAANEVVWKVGNTAYVDMEGDATFNSVTAGNLVTTTATAAGHWTVTSNLTVNGNSTIGNATTDVVKVYLIENAVGTNGIPAYQLYSSNGIVRIWGN